MSDLSIDPNVSTVAALAVGEGIRLLNVRGLTELADLFELEEVHEAGRILNDPRTATPDERRRLATALRTELAKPLWNWSMPDESRVTVRQWHEAVAAALEAVS
jgi:hypothetical protein